MNGHSYYMGCGQGAAGTVDQLCPYLERMERSGEYVAEPKLDGQWVALWGKGLQLRPIVQSRSGRTLVPELPPS